MQKRAIAIMPGEDAGFGAGKRIKKAATPGKFLRERGPTTDHSLPAAAASQRLCWSICVKFPLGSLLPTSLQRSPLRCSASGPPCVSRR